MLKFHPLAYAILLGSGTVYAQSDTDLPFNGPPQDSVQVSVLPTIEITAHSLTGQGDNASFPLIVNHDQLSKGAITLGAALADQAGIHADTFGGGASRPIIRGQSAPRVKVLSDGAEIMDASSVSPDHAITVDPLLAEQVEVIRGPATLLYGGGAIGGMVNVIDHKIPTSMPENGLTGQVGIRADSSAQQRVASAAVTMALGQTLAAHIEGLTRDADDYHTGATDSPAVPGTYTGSKSGSAGISWVTDHGYTGVAYTRRHDEYGLAGDADEYSVCAPDSTATGLVCDPAGVPASQQMPVIHHGEPSAWVRLNSQRMDLRSEYDQPFAGFNHIMLRAGYTDYQHDEMANGEAATSFKNKGYDARLELTHQPIAGFNGIIGMQYSHSDFRAEGEEAFLPATITQNISAFFLEHYQWQKVCIELGGRQEWQTVDPNTSLAKFSQQQSDLSATSVSGSAAWQFIPDYALILSLAHSERLPNAQELYANGPHYATVTYETGNPKLGKEKSNHVELSLRKTAGDATFRFSAYHNQIDDYIYAKTLDQYDRFRLIQYTANDATFDGIEGEASYQFNPAYTASLFGDYVRARLADQSGQDAHIPRIPGGKLGLRINTQREAISGLMSGSLELVHQFRQADLAKDEPSDKSYTVLNASLAYEGSMGERTDYRAYLQLNNLLNKVYYNHVSFLPDLPMQGRNLVAGMQFKF